MIQFRHHHQNKKEIVEAPTKSIFKFSKIFSEQLSTFSSNNLYNEFQQICNNKDIQMELLKHNLLT